MAMLEKISNAMSSAVDTGASLLKTALLSRHPSEGGESKDNRLIILGNGPSLRTTLSESRGVLEKSQLMAVNFFANSPEFNQLRPDYYVLADGHFFAGIDKDPNVARLWENIVFSDWKMTLFVPAGERDFMQDRVHCGGNIKIKYYNLTPAEGIPYVIYPLFDRGLAMPRPRNVMIPSIMLAIREGFKDIVLVGADHSWSRTLWVTDNNRVVSVQPHFYEDNADERERVESEYAGYHLHDILNSLTIAFRSYFVIADYARRRGVRIMNATPGSFIDAFQRVSL